MLAPAQLLSPRYIPRPSALPFACRVFYLCVRVQLAFVRLAKALLDLLHLPALDV